MIIVNITITITITIIYCLCFDFTLDGTKYRSGRKRKRVKIDDCKITESCLT